MYEIYTKQNTSVLSALFAVRGQRGGRVSVILGPGYLDFTIEDGPDMVAEFAPLRPQEYIIPVSY